MHPYEELKRRVIRRYERVYEEGDCPSFAEVRRELGIKEGTWDSWTHRDSEWIGLVRDLREDAEWEAAWRREQATWMPEQRARAEAGWKLMGEWREAQERVRVVSDDGWIESEILREIEHAAGNAEPLIEHGFSRAR
jgi:hypothetical protein